MSVFPPSEAFNPCIEGCKCEEDDRQIINGRTTNVYIYCWRGASAAVYHFVCIRNFAMRMSAYIF